MDHSEIIRWAAEALYHARPANGYLGGKGKKVEPGIAQHVTAKSVKERLDYAKLHMPDAFQALEHILHGEGVDPGTTSLDADAIVVQQTRGKR